MSGDDGDQALSSLVGRLSDQARRLVRLEVRLARAELAHKARVGAAFVAMLALAAVLGLVALATGVTVIVAAIATALPVWAAALIVCAVSGLLAVPLAVVGVRGLTRRRTCVPEETIASIREDVAWARGKSS